jgi:hypothetical protein
MIRSFNWIRWDEEYFANHQKAHRADSESSNGSVRVNGDPYSRVLLRDDCDNPLSHFSGELVFSALKDTPVFTVAGFVSAATPRWSAIWSRAIRIHYPWTTTRVLAAARSDPTGLVRALDRMPIDEVQRVPDLSPGHQEVSR